MFAEITHLSSASASAAFAPTALVGSKVGLVDLQPSPPGRVFPQPSTVLYTEEGGSSLTSLCYYVSYDHRGLKQSLWEGNQIMNARDGWQLGLGNKIEYARSSMKDQVRTRR